MIFGKHTIIKLIFLILAVLALSSCSSRPEQVEVEAEEEEMASSAEAEVREAVYIYKDLPERVTSDKITLAMHNDPLLLPDGYVRLVGVVSGGSPTALVEVGGKGRALKTGDKVGGYRLVSIGKNSIKLIRRGN